MELSSERFLRRGKLFCENKFWGLCLGDTELWVADQVDWDGYRLIEIGSSWWRYIRKMWVKPTPEFRCHVKYTEVFMIRFLRFVFAFGVGYSNWDSSESRGGGKWIDLSSLGTNHFYLGFACLMWPTVDCLFIFPAPWEISSSSTYLTWVQLDRWITGH